MCLVKDLIESVVSLEKKKIKKNKQEMAKFCYGTSGYRDTGEKLSLVVTRTAYFAALRARSMHKSIGLMITASHNPPEDNGVKVIDWTGSMLPVECEPELDQLVNVEDFGQFVHLSCGLLPENNLVLDRRDEDVQVIIGTDTRASSPMLLLSAIKGCDLAKCSYQVFENHTTPQLHFIVRACNDNSFADPGAYVTRFRDAVENFLKLVPLAAAERRRYSPTVYVDCANGVGGLWLNQYLPEMSTVLTAQLSSPNNQAFHSPTNSWPGSKKSIGWMDAEYEGDGLNARVMNDATNVSALLNCKSGADYVKIERKVPRGFEKLPMGSRCASLDGDADRLVYFYVDEHSNDGDEQYKPENGMLKLMDGDHIAALFTRFVVDQFNDLRKVLDKTGRELPLKVGVVQTAYSNGNSRRYFMDKLKIEPVVVKTGVKHLDPAARKFDVGVYFEANGHGTICFSQNFHEFIDSFVNSETGEEIPRPVQLLRQLAGVINEVVGDGIADLLAVECILRYYNWSIQDWELETYKSLPSCSRKVQVKDRERYKTKQDVETELVEPSGLQSKIDAIVKKYKRARAFVRPSGTESIVRIYAEAVVEEHANKLAEELAKLIH
uniref:Phosphoacetylglucosamine mutase n=1 Tax=Ditylenchus dipsaci TaxID=166011 RepID=A0A915E978_9BILA